MAVEAGEAVMAARQMGHLSCRAIQNQYCALNQGWGSAYVFSKPFVAAST